MDFSDIISNSVLKSWDISFVNEDIKTQYHFNPTETITIACHIGYKIKTVSLNGFYVIYNVDCSGTGVCSLDDGFEIRIAKEDINCDSVIIGEIISYILAMISPFR